MLWERKEKGRKDSNFPKVGEPDDTMSWILIYEH